MSFPQVPVILEVVPVLLRPREYKPEAIARVHPLNQVRIKPDSF